MESSKVHLVTFSYCGEFFVTHLQHQHRETLICTISYNYMNFDCFVINLLRSSCWRNLVDSHYIWLVSWCNYFDLIWWCLHSCLRAHVVCTSVTECLRFYMYLHASACLHASPLDVCACTCVECAACTCLSSLTSSVHPTRQLLASSFHC